MPKQKKKKNIDKRTYVMLVVDRSGSMSNSQESVIKGMNEQLKELRKKSEDGGTTEVSILQFDDQFDMHTVDMDPNQIVDWVATDFVPRGSTSLRDAIYRAIAHLKNRPETDDTGYLVSVISDGEENSSKEVTQDLLANEIRGLEASNKWTFSYLMSNIKDKSAFQNAFAVKANNIAYYNSTNAGTYTATNCNAASIGSYMSSRSKGLTSSNDFYSDEQKDIISTSK